MKSVTKLICRFVGILMLSTILLFLVNLTIFLIIGSKQAANSGPWTISSQIAAGLSQTENGIVLSPEMTELLKEEQAWAMYIDNDTLSVLWHTQDLPENIPLQYNIAGIASLTRSYIEGFPTFPSEALNGIVVVGFSQEKYWKHLNPSWDTRLIRNAPWILLSVMGINILILFLIYLITNLKLLNSIQPIADGISALPTKKPVCSLILLPRSIVRLSCCNIRNINYGKRNLPAPTGFPGCLTISAPPFLWSWATPDNWKPARNFPKKTEIRSLSSATRVSA